MPPSVARLGPCSRAGCVSSTHRGNLGSSHGLKGVRTLPYSRHTGSTCLLNIPHKLSQHISLERVHHLDGRTHNGKLLLTPPPMSTDHHMQQARVHDCSSALPPRSHSSRPSWLTARSPEPPYQPCALPAVAGEQHTFKICLLFYF